MGKRTWFDVTDGLLGASNIATGEGFGVPFADAFSGLLSWDVRLINVLGGLLRWDVSLANVFGGLLGGDISLDDARGNSKIGRLLCDRLSKASSLPLS